jgi:hypothetical protein
MRQHRGQAGRFQAGEGRMGRGDGPVSDAGEWRDLREVIFELHEELRRRGRAMAPPWWSKWRESQPRK